MTKKVSVDDDSGIRDFGAVFRANILALRDVLRSKTDPSTQKNSSLEFLMFCAETTLQTRTGAYKPVPWSNSPPSSISGSLNRVTFCVKTPFSEAKLIQALEV